MSSLDYILITIASSITVLFGLECYSKLSTDKLLKLNIRNIIILLLAGIIITINTYTNGGFIRIVMNFTILLFSCLYTFKDNFTKSLFYTLYVYAIMFFYEIVLSIFVNLFFNDLSVFDKNVLFKSLFSILSMSLSLMTCYIKKVRSFYNKISLKFNNLILILVFSFAFLIFILIDVKYSLSFSNSVYIINCIIMTSVIILMILNVFNHIKVEKEMDKTETILSFMSKYEKIIDEDRINKHEMLNNLLALKSFKHKNSKEYEELLDDLIDSYNKKSFGIKNIHNLPSGIKGILYYKLYNLNENDFNVNINISKNTNSSFKNLTNKEYLNLYKIIGILLDNAIESAAESKEKLINIDIYKEKNDLFIVIDNSFDKEVNIKKINNKYYSTKGKNRGLGLYILNKIIKENDNIIFSQSINNKIFTSKLQVKK